MRARRSAGSSPCTSAALCRPARWCSSRSSPTPPPPGGRCRRIGFPSPEAGLEQVAEVTERRRVFAGHGWGPVSSTPRWRTETGSSTRPNRRTSSQSSRSSVLTRKRQLRTILPACRPIRRPTEGLRVVEHAALLGPRRSATLSATPARLPPPSRFAVAPLRRLHHQGRCVFGWGDPAARHGSSSHTPSARATRTTSRCPTRRTARVGPAREELSEAGRRPRHDRLQGQPGHRAGRGRAQAHGVDVRRSEKLPHVAAAYRRTAGKSIGRTSRSPFATVVFNEKANLLPKRGRTRRQRRPSG